MVFHAAIRKYGADAFTHEVLEVVSTQKEADSSETRWIERLGARTPSGYNLKSGGGGLGRHHEESVQRMKAVWTGLTSEEKNEKLRRQKAGMSTVRRSTSALRAWANMTPKARSARVRRMRAATVGSDSIRSEKMRAAWAAMSPDQKTARVRKVRAANTQFDESRSEKTRAWQTTQAEKRTPEQRRQIVVKAWATRRTKYGALGCSKTSETVGDVSRKTWADRTPEAHAEHGRKIQEGHRRSREAKNSRLVRINLLRAT